MAQRSLLGLPGYSRICGTLLSVVAFCTTAFAGGGGDIPCGSAPGVVNEFSANAADFTVQITGSNGKLLKPQPAGFPFNAAGVALPGGGFGAQVPIPAFGFACDVHNIIKPLPKKNRELPAAPSATLPENGGEESDLDLESVFFSGGVYSLQDLFGTIQQALGNGVVVAVPDLFADTNNDGSLDDGDVLYALVDMSVYLQAIPSFTEGEAFNIVNGVVAGLPGMMFSTTEFTFDPSTGFSGTDYTGEGDVLAEHDVMATPEPAAGGLAVAGLLGIFLLRRRSNKKYIHN